MIVQKRLVNVWMLDKAPTMLVACRITARKAKHLDATTMCTYSHANITLAQSERACYLSYFINGYVGLCMPMYTSTMYGYVGLCMAVKGYVGLRMAM